MREARLVVPLFALLLVVTVSGCGQANPNANRPKTGSVSPAAMRVENRLKTQGYHVTLQRRIGATPYTDHLTVMDIDFTSPRSFNVDIFLFTTKSKAETYRDRLRRRAGTFDRSNRYAVVGPDLLVASHSGQAVGCKIVNNAARCPPQPTVPPTAFNKLISIVTG